MTRLTTTAAALLLAAALTACDSNTESASPAPAPSSPTVDAPAAPQPMPTPMPGATASAADPHANHEESLTWTLPKGWKENPEPKSMRMATLLSDTNVEVAVTGFGGAVGGDLANVNRWRGQIGMPPITEAELATATQSVPTAAGSAKLVDITNPNPPAELKDSPRLVAVIVPAKSKTFFLKMTGPVDRLEQSKPGFLELVKSVKVTQ